MSVRRRRKVLSPTTRPPDLPTGVKWDIYERYGAPHYWIVDIDTRIITPHEWRDGAYGPPLVLRPGDTLSSPLFPGITRPVTQIFAGIV